MAASPPGDGQPPAVDPDAFAALARCYVAFCRHVEGEGVVVGLRDGLFYGAVGTDLPDINRVMTADTARLPRPDAIDGILAELVAYRALSWWVPPGPRQADLEALLVRRNLAVNPDDAEAPGMVADLAGLPALVEELPGVEIGLADSSDAAAAAAVVTTAGFGMSDGEGAVLAQILRRIGERPAGPSRYFVAHLNGRPVATSIGVLDGDALAIYCVATIPEARGRGIGRAVTLAALLDGRDRGARSAVLEASAMGRPVYRKLGFRDAGASRVLVRRPA